MESMVSLDYCTTVDGECRNIRSELDLRSSNTSSLLKIQEVMNSMEDKKLTLDEVLSRVIQFYRKYVPF